MRSEGIFQQKVLKLCQVNQKSNLGLKSSFPRFLRFFVNQTSACCVFISHIFKWFSFFFCSTCHRYGQRRSHRMLSNVRRYNYNSIAISRWVFMVASQTITITIHRTERRRGVKQWQYAVCITQCTMYTINILFHIMIWICNYLKNIVPSLVYMPKSMRTIITGARGYAVLWQLCVFFLWPSKSRA